MIIASFVISGLSIVCSGLTCYYARKARIYRAKTADLRSQRLYRGAST